MTTAATAQARTEKLDLRLTPSAKTTLQTAASVANQTLTEFVLESALSRAEETLPDRQHFSLSFAQWIEFQKTLDAPVRPLPRLAKLLTEPSVFEKGL